MEIRHLGKTEIEITPIGLGAWQFSQGRGGATGVWASLSAEETDAIIQAALDGGINWFDTAEAYGFGNSERGLARGLQKAGKSDDEVIIATKWMPVARFARSIKNTFKNRKEALAPYSIDLHQIHFPASFSSIEAQMDSMADLAEAGKIRSIGVSNFSAIQMHKAYKTLASRGFVLASNQVHYSLLERGIETNGVLEAAQELGITIIAYSPLEMGLLTGKFHKDPELLKSRPAGRRAALKRKIESTRPVIEILDEIATAHDVTPAQVALSWIIRYHGESIVAIPGASKVRHVEQNVGAMRLQLTGEEMARLEEVSRGFGGG